MAIETHLDGKPVTRLQAARALAVVDGQSVEIGEPNASGWIEHGITVYPRRSRLDGIEPAQVHWSSYAGVSAADARMFSAMIALGAEVAELAEMIAAEQVTEFTTSSQGAPSAPCTQPEQHHPNLAGAAVGCDVAGHHGPARISEAAVDKAMAATLGWCPATTGPDDELARPLYCDKQLGEDNKHAGNHHAHVGDGSEVAWGDEDDPYIRKGTRFPLVGTEPKPSPFADGVGCGRRHPNHSGHERFACTMHRNGSHIAPGNPGTPGCQWPILSADKPKPVVWQCTYCWTEYEAMPSQQPPACPECGPLHGPGAAAAQPRIKPEPGAGPDDEPPTWVPLADGACGDGAGEDGDGIACGVPAGHLRRHEREAVTGGTCHWPNTADPETGSEPQEAARDKASTAAASLVGTIVEDAYDDSPCPVTGKVVGQVDEEHVMVVWGDRQHAENPGPRTRARGRASRSTRCARPGSRPGPDMAETILNVSPRKGEVAAAWLPPGARASLHGEPLPALDLDFGWDAEIGWDAVSGGCRLVVHGTWQALRNGRRPASRAVWEHAARLLRKAARDGSGPVVVYVAVEELQEHGRQVLTAVRVRLEAR